MRRYVILIVAAAVALWLAAVPSADAQPSRSQPSCMGQPATIVGGRHEPLIVGTPGPDVIVATTGSISASGGADLICVQHEYSNYAVHGGSGDDRVQVLHGLTVVYGDGGDDRIQVRHGGGTAFGGRGDDVLTVNGNRHVGARMVGGAGDDVLREPPGVHRGSFFPGPGDDIVRGGPGHRDCVAFSGAKQGVTVDLRKGSARGQGRDRLYSVECAAGSPRADVLYGDAGKNRIEGMVGDDIIRLRGGDDVGYGLRGDDVVVGGPGDDSLSGNGGSDALYGNAGRDSLRETNNPKPNLIDGGTGSDRCYGGYTVPPNVEISCERH